MARHISSMYESLQGGVSRLTEDLASSLHLDNTDWSARSEYITSPSAASTYSNHSLFSQQSHISSHTNHSSRPTSDTGHCMIRNAAAHPSAHRILSLHHHSPDATPKKTHVHSTPNTQRRSTHHALDICLPLDDSRSRYFARRNAIAPLPRKELSSFGPMRTSRSVKTARTPFAGSRVSFTISANRH